MRPPDTPKMLETPNSLSPAISPRPITTEAEICQSMATDAEYKPFVGCYKCGALDHQATNRNCPRPRKPTATATAPAPIKRRSQKSGEEKAVKRAKKGEQTKYWYYASEDSEEGARRIRVKHEEQDCDTRVATTVTSSPDTIVNINSMEESAKKGANGTKESPQVCKKPIVQKKASVRGGPRPNVPTKQQATKIALKNLTREKLSCNETSEENKNRTQLDLVSHGTQNFPEYWSIRFKSPDVPDDVVDDGTEDISLQPFFASPIYNEDPSSPLRGRQALRKNNSLNVDGSARSRKGAKDSDKPLTRSRGMQTEPLQANAPQSVESLVLTKEYTEFLDLPENDPYSVLNRAKHAFNYMGARNDVCAPGRVSYGGRSYQGWRECRTANGEGADSMLW